MVRLRVMDLIRERGMTRYQVFKQLGMSYQNFKRMVDNETISIHYETIESLCAIFDCEPGELFTRENPPLDRQK